MAEEAAPVETAQETIKHKGTVKWFNPSKGFGFITPDDGGSDLFVHQTSILAEGFRSLREGEPVEYQTEPTEDGRTKAIQVSGPDGAAPQGAPKRPFVPQPVIPVMYEPQQGVYIAMPGPGRGPGGQIGQMGQIAYVGGPGMGRGRGRGRGPPRPEGRAPPGTPGVSSGLQVVVHNLPWACTWQMLKDHFTNQQGLERADVITDPDGRSRGFGTVRFATPDDALAAIQAVNNTELAGRVISVRIDRYA